MSQAKTSSLPEGVKVLTEAEIQERLYGAYLGPRKKSRLEAPVVAPRQVQSEVKQVPDPEWTGVELLTSEFKRLRSELLTLRQEQVQLTQELSRRAGKALPAQDPPRPAPQVQVQEGSIEFFGFGSAGPSLGIPRFLGIAAGAVFVVGLIGLGYPLGVRLLQASPIVVTEPSPYTVQVAVYDVKAMADQALQRLQALGYYAFVVELPRRDGRPRYRIYVGRFVTKQEAQMERVKLSADPRFLDSFVRIQ